MTRTNAGRRTKHVGRASALRSAPERRRGAPKTRKPRYSAKTADRYELYQLAVQSPENDIAFLRRQFRKLAGREALHLREDFCGTALMAATWVSKGLQYTAEGFDLDPEPLDWGRARNLAPLGPAAERVVLHEADVRAPGLERPDLRVAQNFSYCIFKKRRELLDYFRLACESLAPGGVFAIDLYGGTEATEQLEEPRKIDGGFTYVWEQARYLPGSGDYTCKIHFEFRDGTKLRDAFSYEWRFWGLPELRDVLQEAGFSKVAVYFEQSDEDDGSGNGVFKRDDVGKSCENCAGWIAYLLAQQ
jgi:SAM-dependent methyltransferase